MFSLFMSLALVHSFETYPLKNSKLGKVPVDSSSSRAQGELDDHDDTYLMAELKVGTPSQEVKLVLGTEFSVLVVPSYYSTLSEAKRRYNAGQSSTYKYVNYTSIQAYNKTLTGDTVTEKVAFNDLVASDQTIIVANSSEFDVISAGGYLGLGFQYYDFESPNLVATLKAQGKIYNSEFSIDFKNEILMIGGYDDQRYTKLEKTVLDVVTTNSEWELELESASVGEVSVYDKPSSLFVFVEENLIVGPNDAIEKIVAVATEGKNCISVDWAMGCECKEHSYGDYPNINLNVGGQQLKLTPESYIYYDDDRCYLLFYGIDSEEWVVGRALLVEYATVFNFDSKSITLFRFDDDSNLRNMYFLIGGVALVVLIAVIVVIVVLVRRKRFIENDQANGGASYGRMN